jgi:hypothetical protein
MQIRLAEDLVLSRERVEAMRAGELAYQRAEQERRGERGLPSRTSWAQLSAAIPSGARSDAEAFDLEDLEVDAFVDAREDAASPKSAASSERRGSSAQGFAFSGYGTLEQPSGASRQRVGTERTAMDSDLAEAMRGR